MRRQTAVAGPRQCLVRTALAIREDRSATTGELFALAAAISRRGLSLRELRVGLDVDLPAGQPRGEPCVQALFPDRERELVVRDDDRRLFRLVVHEDLPDARGRQRLGEEAR